MGRALRDELLRHGLRLLEEVPVAALEGGHRIMPGPLALDADAGGIDAVLPEHREHALPRRRRFREADHRLAHEVLPGEGGERLPAREKESASATRLREVDDDGPALVDEGEAPHQPAEADLDVAVEQRPDRVLAERGGGHHGDVEPLVGEVSERDPGGERRVERRVKRHQHGHGAASHGRGV